MRGRLTGNPEDPGFVLETRGTEPKMMSPGISTVHAFQFLEREAVKRFGEAVKVGYGQGQG